MTNFSFRLQPEERAEAYPSASLRAIIESIVSVVPVSHWSFVCAASGTRMGLRPAPLRPAADEVHLEFSDGRDVVGTLSLKRADALPGFTPSECRTLDIAAAAGSERLSEMRLMESQDSGLEGFRPETVGSDLRPDGTEHVRDHYVLNMDLEIVLSGSIDVAAESRLPPIVEDAVRRLTADWTQDASTQHAGSAQPVPFLKLRTQPLNGTNGLFVSLTVERGMPTRSLTAASARFNISPREVQVLALLLDGLTLGQMAAELHITSSTVQDHIKSLLDKTDSQSRQAMSSKILGWPRRAESLDRREA